MLRNEEGMSIVMVFGIMVILGILASALIVRALGERQITTYLKRSEIAFNAAEACLNLAIARLLEADNVSPIPDTGSWYNFTTCAFYKTGIPDSAPEPIVFQGSDTKKLMGTEFGYLQYRIRASGKMEQITRSIEAGVRVGPLPHGPQH